MSLKIGTYASFLITNLKIYKGHQKYKQPKKRRKSQPPSSKTNREEPSSHEELWKKIKTVKTSIPPKLAMVKGSFRKHPWIENQSLANPFPSKYELSNKKDMWAINVWDTSSRS